MTAGRSSSARRDQVLAALRDAAEPLSLAAVAERVGIHTNTARFHVERLLASGQVEQVEGPRPATGRPAAYYRASRRMDPEGPRHYRLLSEILLSALGSGADAGARAADAGRAWGARIAREQRGERPGVADDVEDGRERLVGLMDELGFAPEPHGETLALRHCPFLEMAEGRRDVICPVHLGIMQGALEAWGSDVTTERLEPFREPDLCLAHLGTRGGRC